MKIKFQIENVLYILAVFFTTLSCILSYWGIETTVSFFQVSFYFLVLWYFVVFHRTMAQTVKFRNFIFLCMYLFIIFGLLIMGFSGTPLRAIAFIVSLFILYIIMQRSISKKQFDAFMIISTIGAVLFFAAYLKGNTYYFRSVKTILDFNPQNVGVWAYLFACSCLVGFFYVKKIYLKALYIILIANFVKIAIETNTRFALYALIFVLVLIFAPANNFITHKKIAPLAAGIPAMFVVLFITLWKFNLFQDIAGSGTILTDREVIWDHYLGIVSQSPIFGLYREYESIYTHNAFVDYVLAFGYPAAILWCILMGYTIYRQCCAVNAFGTKLQYAAYLSFVGALIIAGGEGSMLGTGAGGTLIYAYSFLFIMGYNPKFRTK